MGAMCDRPRFFILRDSLCIFFFFSLLQLCNISHFWSKSKKMWLKIFENNWKSFLQKMSDLGEILVFLGESFLPQEKKKY